MVLFKVGSNPVFLANCNVELQFGGEAVELEFDST